MRILEAFVVGSLVKEFQCTGRLPRVLDVGPSFEIRTVLQDSVHEMSVATMVWKLIVRCRLLEYDIGKELVFENTIGVRAGGRRPITAKNYLPRLHWFQVNLREFSAGIFVPRGHRPHQTGPNGQA